MKIQFIQEKLIGINFGNKLLKLISIVLISSIAISSFGHIYKAQAAPLTAMSDTLSRQKASTASNHTIKFRTPTGVSATLQTITVTFPAGFNLTSIVFGDVDFSHGASTGAETEETLAATAAAGVWGAAVALQVLTLTAPTNAAGGEVTANDYCIIEIGTNAAGPGTNQIVNPTAGANIRISFVVNTVDTGVIATAIISDDQVVVSGSTDATLAYTISTNSVSLGTLSSASLAVGSALTMTANTNALTGYELSYYGPTLTSGGNSITAFPNSATASATGTEQFGLRATATGGSGTVQAPYATANYAFNPANAAYPPILVGKSTIASVDTTYTIIYAANIAAVTEAGTYTTTQTWLCTGLF